MRQDKERIFTLENVSFFYNQKRPVFEDISLEVFRGERLVLLGPNGSGKSTLLKLLAGLIFPTSGTVRAFGTALTPAAFKNEGFNFAFRRRVGLVLQNAEAQLFCPTVRDEVAFGPLHLGFSQVAVEERVAETLSLLGITHLRDRPPHQLSDGEKKKVALAAVLAVNPEVLLLDEPTANLDPRSQHWLLNFLRALSQVGKTIVVATHELVTVPVLAQRVLVLGEDHGLVTAGEPEAVLADRELLLRANLVHPDYHLHQLGTGKEHLYPHVHLGLEE
ncbi:cobalt/nickel transport system ATP-binding protein [Thermodesulfitimonas autotrophica]|uniref:Cobalt/nickel transport system ATP-binding protein n=1 Tax=Thermodesulfitimonas autotrophica TaxID=1894989 RepID=A0A3N5AWQ2_9THEO|nr:ABC transporter ATP-binding protein [Thermodesulfitimonas autotrophica]RPF49347.1 cobalt/nickel transport system ATP-binding protein [Thermodesulfitimonas autotrophica]